MEYTPAETMRPFHRTTPKEISSVDKEFVLKTMRLDWRQTERGSLVGERLVRSNLTHATAKENTDNCAEKRK